MSITNRLAKVEAELPMALLRWCSGLPKPELRQALDLTRKYLHLCVPRPGGKVDMESALRAIALEEGFDYTSVRDEARRAIRRLRSLRSAPR